MSKEDDPHGQEKSYGPLSAFRLAAARTIATVADLPEETVYGLLESPPRPDLGDFAFPCFSLAKTHRKAPPMIAASMVETLNASPFPELITAAQATGPYINISIDHDRFCRAILELVLAQGESYGNLETGKGKAVVIDYSSPNVAKPFGIGHLRSTVIGAALARIHRAAGYEVFGINHLGDWGTQFGKMMVACMRWGKPGENDPDPVKTMFNLYVRFHKEAESDPSLEDEGRAWFKKLEEGDPEAHKYWVLLSDIGRTEFSRIYDRLGIQFEHFTGESFYNDKLTEMVDLIKEKGLLETSQDAQIVNLEKWDMPPALVKKADDSSLYLTRDLAALLYRHRTFQFTKALYVVGMEQTLHFRQLFKVGELLGLDWVEGCEHIPFGLIRFKEGRMSTRHGKIIFLEEVLDRSVDLVQKIIDEKNPELENKEEVAHAIGIGAIVFNDLKHRRLKDVQFDWDEILNFDGKTGPYLQYSHARISSILRRSNETPTALPEKLQLDLPEEKDLVRRLATFSRVIQSAADESEPSYVSTYLLDLAEVFNRYYNLGGKNPANRVLCEDQEIRSSRLCLVLSVKTVLQKGLALLGVKAPEKM